MTAQTPMPPADPTAVVGRRIFAYVIDAVILLVLVVVLFASLASSEDLGSSFQAEVICDGINDADSGFFCIRSDSSVILIDEGDFGLIVLIAALYGFVTHMLLPGITGFSPGKAMVGLRVVKQETFEKAGLGANFVRWLLWIVDSAPWCFPLVGLITGLSSKGHRRVGDMAAKTVVIDRKWVGQPLPIAGVNQVPPSAPPPPGVGVAGFSTTPFGTPPPPAPGTAVSSPTPPPASMPSAPPAPPTASSSPPPPTPPASAESSPPLFEGFPPAPVAPPAPAAPPPSAPPPDPSVLPTGDDGRTNADSEAPTDAEAPAEGDTAAYPAAPATEPGPPAPPAPPSPSPEPPRPGIDIPQWDAARDTYIQWDPELSEWMEWNEAAGAWVPISR